MSQSELALTSNIAVLDPKAQRALIKAWKEQQFRQDILDTGTKLTGQAVDLGKSVMNTVSTAVSNNELAAGVAMWLVVHELTRRKYLDNLSSGFLKAAVVAGSTFDIINPFD